MGADKQEIALGVFRQTPSNSIRCNGQRLKQFRQNRGWTQSELARIAGYTERLISKAENGNCLARATIEDLAEALSTGANCVTVDELVMTRESVAQKIVTQIKGIVHADVDDILELLAEEVTLRVRNHAKSLDGVWVISGKPFVEKLLRKTICKFKSGILSLGDGKFICSDDEVSVWLGLLLGFSSSEIICCMEISIWVEIVDARVIRVDFITCATNGPERNIGPIRRRNVG